MDQVLFQRQRIIRQMHQKTWITDYQQHNAYIKITVKQYIILTKYQ